MIWLQTAEKSAQKTITARHIHWIRIQKDVIYTIFSLEGAKRGGLKIIPVGLDL